MENLAIEIKFAQNLAGNETKTRLKALKKLKKYLRAKSGSKKDGFSAEDLLKLWKGLHYCMWMQDKPLLQEELSTTLTQLVHDMSTVEAQMLFIKVFFITEAREWNSIDIWRLDKFMMMVRNMLYESLMVVKKLKWDAKQLDQLSQVYSETLMDPDSDAIPDGLRIHFSDIYLEEVEKVGEGRLTGSQLLKLLIPFVKFMQKAKNMTLLKRVRSRVIDPVITRLADEVKLQQMESSGNENSKENDDVPLLSLKFDGKLISDHLFKVSQEDSVLIRNRPMLYEIVTKLKDIQGGALPQKKEVVIPDGVSNKDIQKAVNELMNLDKNKNRKKKLKQKRNKLAKQHGESGVNENADPNNNSAGGQEPETAQIPSTSHIGGKRKHSLTEDSGDESLTKIKKKKLESDNSVTEKKTLKKLMNKFSKLDMTKGKKDKKVDVDVHDKAANAQSKKKIKSGSVKKQEKMDVNVAVTGENEGTDKAEALIVSAEVPPSMKRSVESKSPGTLKKKGKRTHIQTQSAESSPNTVSVSAASGSSAVPVPEIVVEESSPVVKFTGKDSDLQDGEVEIWVPNKKYKGNVSVTPTANFATFDHSKPPMAFVRRSLSKSLKKTPSALKTPGSGKTPASNKRVSFDMKKNKAQAFKESLNSPLTPFNPTKKPESGILKSPVETSGPAIANHWSITATQGAINGNGSLQTPVTRQAAQQIVARRSSHVVTPVVSIGFGKKKVAPMRRKHAADFFL